jgi:drug/metabolite transporter (DMT)-like permease
MLQVTSPQGRTLHFQQTGAMLQGLLAVVLFSLTVPMTKIAMDVFSAEFIAACRGFIAGALCLLVVVYNDWSFPKFKECLWLLLSGLGVVVAFPYLLSLTLESVSAANMGIILAGLPLATSLMAVVLLGERYRAGFWVCALLGAGVLMLYFSQSQAAVLPKGEGELGRLFLLAITTLLLGGMGYAAGTRAAKTLGGWPTICWMLVLFLPFSALAFGFFGYEQLGLSGVAHTQEAINSAAIKPQVSASAYDLKAWLSIFYLALISQWWGFRFLYSAMAEAGAGTIGQIQLLQPFFTLGFSAWLLMEPLQISQFAFLGVIICLVAGAIKFK